MKRLKVKLRGQLVHHEEAARNLTLGLFLLTSFFTIGDGCMADASTEQTAEATQTLKAHFEANISYAQFVGNQKLFSFLDAPLDQVLMRSFVESLTKEAEEMITGETSLFGNLVQAQRMVVTVVDELTSAPESFERRKTSPCCCYVSAATPTIPVRIAVAMLASVPSR